MPFTVKATLKAEAKDDKTQAVRLRVTKDRKSAYYSPGIYILKSQWKPRIQNEKQVWVKGHLTSDYFNNAIRNDIDGLIHHGLQNPTLTAGELVKSYKAAKEDSGPKHEPCFLEYLLKELARGKEVRNPRSTERMESTTRKLKEFAGEPLPFSRLTVAFVRDFITHLEVTRRNRTSTIHTDIAMLKKFASYAMAEGLMEYKDNPFLTIRLSKKARKKARFDMETFEKFRDFELTDPKQINARNTFLCSFYLHGARINDVLELKWKAISKDRVRFTMDKTDKDKDIKITPQLQQILDFYRPAKGEKPMFVFPYLKESDTELPLDRYQVVIDNKRERINVHLKAIVKAMGLDINISTHTARHTFADFARKKIKDTHTIKNLLNHSSITTTEKYLSSFDQTDEDAASDSIYG